MVGELLSINRLKVWGRHPKAPGWHGLPPGEGRRCLKGRGLWHSPGVDQSSSGPGFYDGGGIGNPIHLHLPWTRLAVCPYPVIMKAPTTCPSPRTSTLASCPRERQRVCVGGSAKEYSHGLGVLHPSGICSGWQSDVLWVLQIITDPHPPLWG